MSYKLYIIFLFHFKVFKEHFRIGHFAQTVKNLPAMQETVFNEGD